MKKYIGLLILFVLILVGCSPIVESEYEKLHGNILRYNQLDYIAKIKVNSNKNVTRYVIKYTKIGNESYKAEIIYPDNLKGLVSIYSSKEYKQVNNNIDDSIEVKNKTKMQPNPIMLNSFLKSYMQTQIISTLDLIEGVSKYHIIKIPVVGDKYHINKQALRVNKKTRLPECITIYNKKGNVTIKADYDFNEYNDDSIKEAINQWMSEQ